MAKRKQINIKNIMKECKFKIEYPDHFSNSEIVHIMLGQMDIKMLNHLGIKVYSPEEFNWFD